MTLLDFQKLAYIMPGNYELYLKLNNFMLGDEPLVINVIENSSSSSVCIDKNIIDKIALTSKALEMVEHSSLNGCYNLLAIPGSKVLPDIGQGFLNISIPQKWIEYIDETWLPISMWDDGISGFIFDYNVNYQYRHGKNDNKESVSYSGTVGANYRAWRIRTNYQGGNGGQGNELTRFYGYRAIPSLHSKLSIGEDFINSDIFDSWRYTGVSLESDERMLPPNKRGYAPQINGVADTNARVVVSQMGRILYDTTVPSGPFSIRDLDSNIRGKLDVEIKETDGTKKNYQVDTSYVPYLTRPGKIRYKTMIGRSRTDNHKTEGPIFILNEASWGISNRWSLYGGGIISDGYSSLSVGFGRDLLQYGTLSADVTQSLAHLDKYGSKKGKSYRISYSKSFTELGADISFAGYRFSEKNYLTMQQFLDAEFRDDINGQEKESYSLSLNKNINKLDASISLQYNHQTYWDINSTKSYTLSINRYFDLYDLKNLALGFTASKSTYSTNDYLPYDRTSYFLRLSIPIGNGNIGYSGNYTEGSMNNNISYSTTMDDGLGSYSINSGLSSSEQENNKLFSSAYLSRDTPYTNFTTTLSYQDDGYSTLGISISGGATITGKGASLHSGGINGSTRLLVDTDSIAEVPIDNGRVVTNRFGIGVVTDLSSYYRNRISIDVNKLPDDIESKQGVKESFLTEGAIGYKKFKVLKGSKLFATLKFNNGSPVTFGTSVQNRSGLELGVVGDNGLVWLTGVVPSEDLIIHISKDDKCVIKVPKELIKNKILNLSCITK
ncbi:TPA: fimbria/pilus outer membrane usher protein [Photobacterium damselae subsp. damselae]